MTNKKDCDIVIIVDTREQSNQHIISVFDTFKIPYVVEKLDFGDYSCYAKTKDGKLIDMRNEISIERKNSLDEIAGNFTKGRDRFKREFERHQGQMILAIEDDNYLNLMMGDYRSKMSKKSLMASLHSWSFRYNVPFIFLPKECMAVFIYFSCKYKVRELEQ